MQPSQIIINQDTYLIPKMKGISSSHDEPNHVKSNMATSDKQTDSVKIDARHFKLTKIDSANDTFNTIAENLHEVSSTMETIEGQINQMLIRLKTHIKSFPPFSPGSEERVKLLKEFSSFRKQIDQMTFPPKHEYAGRIMSDPASNPEAGELEIIIGQNGPSKTIHTKEIHTGPTGLDLPEVPETAPDDLINDIISRLEKAQNTLKHVGAELSDDIENIADLKKYVVPLDDIPEAEVYNKSQGIGHILAQDLHLSLTKTFKEYI